MAYSPCPHGGGRVPEAPGQGRPAAPATPRFREIPVLVPAAGILLVLVIAAILVQVFILHPMAEPMAANASTSPSPAVIPDISRTPAILTTAGPSSLDPNNAGDGSGPDSSATTILTIPVLSTTPAPAGPLIIITVAPKDSSPGPARGYSKEVPVINATTLEVRIHARVNKVRQEHGLSALGTDMALVSLARSHSGDMAARGYFGHVNLDERDATARGAAAGYTCHKAADTYYTYAIAENLYATYRYAAVLLKDSQATCYAWTAEEAMAEETVNAWMNSPDHRDNILDPGMGREGIGVAFGQGDMVFVTQDFC